MEYGAGVQVCSAINRRDDLQENVRWICAHTGGAHSLWDGQLDNSVFIMSNAEVDAEPTTHPSFFRYPVVPVTQTGHFTSTKVREGEGKKEGKSVDFRKSARMMHI